MLADQGLSGFHSEVSAADGTLQSVLAEALLPRQQDGGDEQLAVVGLLLAIRWHG